MATTTIATLPTELLCIIFRYAVATGKPSQPSRQVGDQDGDGSASEFSLPALKNLFELSLAISHVCRSWRRISLDLPGLWSHVHLTIGRCLKGESLCRTILGRSRRWPLHLDISATWRGAAGDSSASEPTCVIANAWAHILHRRVLIRCRSLRVAGAYTDVCSVLAVFAHYNRSVPLHYKRINALHVIWDTTRTSSTHDHADAQRAPTPMPMITPVAMISSNLSSARSEGRALVGFPRWSMDAIVLQDIPLPRGLYRALIGRVGVRRLVLRRVQIPPGLNQESMSIQERARWNEHYDTSRVRLQELEFDSPLDGYTVNEEDPYRNYATFFREALIPSCAKTLCVFRLTELSLEAWRGLDVLLSERPEVTFPKVSKVILKRIAFGKRPGDPLRNVKTVFPAADVRVEQRMKVRGWYGWVLKSWAALRLRSERYFEVEM